MFLTISGKLPDLTSLSVCFNNEVKEISDLDNSIKFHVEKPGLYPIRILQSSTPCKLKISEKILYFFISVIVAFISCFTLHFNMDWYKDICPYYVEIEFDIEINNDRTIEIIFSKTKYRSNSWSKPDIKVKIKSVKNYKKHIMFNKYSFNTEFILYKIKILAFLIIPLIILLFVGITLIFANHLIFASFPFAVSIFLIVICILKIRHENKRKHSLYDMIEKELR